MENIDKYSDMMPIELKMLVNSAPKDDLDWGLVMYLFENTKDGNIITLGKISNFFGVDKDIMFSKLSRMEILWIRKHTNTGEYGNIYYTYEISDIAAELIVKLVELLGRSE